MSFGFYRLPHGSSYEDYVKHVAQGRIAIKTIPHEPIKQLKLDSSPTSIVQGFTGNTCIHCQSVMMIRSGHCEVCTNCGATTGCS